MLDSLNYLGNKVVGRYKTVEANIKSRSNSFYDSFLDLIEETVKTILVNEDVGYEGRTCGEILREPDVINFFRHKVGIEKDAFEKISNYIKKINEHKHNNEKYLNIETVINYTNSYYAFIKPYLVSKNIEIIDYNESYYKAIYGLTIERSNQLDNVSQKVDEIANTANIKFDEHSSRIDFLETKLDELSVEYSKCKNQTNPTNFNNNTSKPNDKEIFHIFLKTSNKSLRWFGNSSEFKKRKILTIFSQVFLIVMGILSTIITAKNCGEYAPLSILENIWLIFGFCYLIYTIKSKHIYESAELAKNNSYKYTQDKFGLWTRSKEKIVFKIFRWIALFGAIGNIILFWTEPSKYSCNLLATIFEVIMIVAIIFSFFMNVAFFAQYSIIYFEGKTFNDNKRITLVWDSMTKKFLNLEDYKKKIPFLFD